MTFHPAPSPDAAPFANTHNLNGVPVTLLRLHGALLGVTCAHHSVGPGYDNSLRPLLLPGGERVRPVAAYVHPQYARPSMGDYRPHHADHDLLVLVYDRDLAPPPLALSSSLEADGDDWIATGYPQGRTGMHYTPFSGYTQNSGRVLFDGESAPGMSGGGVFCKRGNEWRFVAVVCAHGSDGVYASNLTRLQIREWLASIAKRHPLPLQWRFASAPAPGIDLKPVERNQNSLTHKGGGYGFGTLSTDVQVGEGGIYSIRLAIEATCDWRLRANTPHRWYASGNQTELLVRAAPGERFEVSVDLMGGPGTVAVHGIEWEKIA